MPVTRASVASGNRTGSLAILRALPIALAAAVASGLIVALLLVLILAHAAATLGHIVVAIAVRLFLVVTMTRLRVVCLIAHDEMISE